MSALSTGSLDGFIFEELKAYIGFGPRDEELLKAGHAIVAPHIPAIVDAFYTALNDNPRTKAVFEGPAQVERLRKTLAIWLDEAYRGPWNVAYFERRRNIGRVHVEVGLLPHFMGGAMNVIRRHVVRVLLEHGASIEHIEATERLLDLELGIMHQSYWDHMMQLKLTVPLALATGLAHEIRNPLNAISLNLKILERRLHKLGADDGTPILESVRAEVARISNLTREIMDFAKPLDLNRVWHRSSLFLRDVTTMHAPAFEAAEVQLVAEATGDPYCYCDIDRMRQAVVNLLTNAIEAVEPGGRVTVRVHSEAGVSTISVADTGHGMEPTLAYRIFDLFYTQKASGTGLGLPIVKHIVEAHGGSIEVLTRLEQGSTFTIRIPRPDHSPGALEHDG